MTTDFRALCAELAEALERAACGLNNSTAKTGYRSVWAREAFQAAARARAALADEPAVPLPLADAVATVESECLYFLTTETGRSLTPDLIASLYGQFRGIIAGLVDALALADAPAAPAPPADGGVAELVEWLLDEAIQAANASQPTAAGMLTWAAQVVGEHAELLQRQVPVQVPVAERPWEREGWCDELGRCWWGRPDTGDWSADWTLATPEAIAEFCEFSPQTVCLPAQALPLSEAGE